MNPIRRADFLLVRRAVGRRRFSWPAAAAYHAKGFKLLFGEGGGDDFHQRLDRNAVRRQGAKPL